MSPVEAFCVPLPPKTGKNMLHPRPPPIVELVSTLMNRRTKNNNFMSNIYLFNFKLVFRVRISRAGARGPACTKFLSLLRDELPQTFRRHPLDIALPLWQYPSICSPAPPLGQYLSVRSGDILSILHCNCGSTLRYRTDHRQGTRQDDRTPQLSPP